MDHEELHGHKEVAVEIVAQPQGEVGPHTLLERCVLLVLGVDVRVQAHELPNHGIHDPRDEHEHHQDQVHGDRFGQFDREL